MDPSIHILSAAALTNSPDFFTSCLNRSQDGFVEEFEHATSWAFGIQIEYVLDPFPILLAELEFQRIQRTDDLDLNIVVLVTSDVVSGSVLVHGKEEVDQDYQDKNWKNSGSTEKGWIGISLLIFYFSSHNISVKFKMWSLQKRPTERLEVHTYVYRRRKFSCSISQLWTLPEPKKRFLSSYNLPTNHTYYTSTSTLHDIVHIVCTKY